MIANAIRGKFYERTVGMNEYINKIIHGDCMEILKQLPDKCIDLVLTDPPYGGGSVGGGEMVKGFKKQIWGSV